MHKGTEFEFNWNQEHAVSWDLPLSVTVINLCYMHFYFHWLFHNWHTLTAVHNYDHVIYFMSLLLEPHWSWPLYFDNDFIAMNTTKITVLSNFRDIIILCAPVHLINLQMPRRPKTAAAASRPKIDTPSSRRMTMRQPERDRIADLIRRRDGDLEVSSIMCCDIHIIIYDHIYLYITWSTHCGLVKPYGDIDMG